MTTKAPYYAPPLLCPALFLYSRYSGDDGEGVGLSVQHPVLQGQNTVVTEEQKQVFQSLCNKETLHYIVFGSASIVDVFYSRETATRY